MNQSDPIREWSTDGFVDEFVQLDRNSPDRRFCFIIGAGASKQSGIPTGAELVDRWLQELKRKEGPRDQSLEDWATAENLGLDSGYRFDLRAHYYADIFERRFQHDQGTSYGYLEGLLENKLPSFGYMILSKILAGTRHNAVITTNFDQLVTKALFSFTEVAPRTVGHENLAEFARPTSGRPTIAKIHRDLFFNPKNTTYETRELPDSWKESLKSILDIYTPIVIGYGGNDGSLMGFLDQFIKERNFVGNIHWCFLHDEKIDDRIGDILKTAGGLAVRILGFDELMLVLGEKLGIVSYEAEVKRRADHLVENLDKQLSSLRKAIDAKGKLFKPRGLEGREGDQNAVRQAIENIERAEIEVLKRDTENLSSQVSLGRKLLDSEDFEEARIVFERILQINRAANQPFSEATTLANLGRAFLGLQKYREAEKRLTEALELNRELQNAEGSRIANSLLGGLYKEWFQVTNNNTFCSRAIDHFEAAVKLALELKLPAAVVYDATQLAEVLEEKGKTHAALRSYQLAAQNARRDGNKFFLQKIHGLIGSVHRNMGNYSKSREYYTSALRVAVEEGYPVPEAILCDNLGIVEAAEGNYEKAEEYFRRSERLDMSDNANNIGVGKSRSHLAILNRFLGRDAIADTLLRSAEEEFRKSSAGKAMLNKLKSAWEQARHTDKLDPTNFI